MQHLEIMDYAGASEFREEIDKFAKSFIASVAKDVDRIDQLPENLNEELAKRRLFAFDRLSRNEDELDVQTRCLLIVDAIEVIAKVSPPIAKHVMDQNFGPVAMLRAYGSKTLKDKYLPLIQAGRRHAAFLMTEPQSGSDIGLFTTVARDTDTGVVISGTKDWITGAANRELHFVVALRAPGAGSAGLFLVDRSTYSLTDDSIKLSGRKEKLGLRGLGEYRVEMNDVHVPVENIVLPCDKSSLRKIMTHYNFKRCGQAAISLGIAKSTLEIAYDYLSARYPREGGGLAFQSAEFDCAEMYTSIQGMEQTVKWAIDRLVSGDDSGVPSSVAKSLVTESAVVVASRAAQLCGANGLSDILPIERLLRDARMLTVAGGTTATMKNTISKNLPKLLQSGTYPNNCQWYK